MFTFEFTYNFCVFWSVSHNFCCLVLNNIILSLQIQGKYFEAIASYDNAIRLNTSVIDKCFFMKGGILHSQMQYLEAVVAFEKAIAVNPTESEYHMARGTALESIGRLDEALACFEAAILLNPAPDYLMKQKSFYSRHFKS